MTAGFLLDTNVVSETRKTQCNRGVSEFLAAQPQSRLFVSVLTIGELRKGAAMRRAARPDFANQLSVWIDTIETSFGRQILSVDTAIAHRWGELSADRTRPVIDTLLAATALVHGLALVTRNTIDARGTGVKLLDPFT